MENTTTSWRDFPLVLVNSSRSTMSWKDLPADLEMDILLRLPAKTLVRASSVKKSWYSLIKNRNFILAHINRSIAYANKNDEHFLLTTPKSMAKSLNQCSIISDRTCSESEKIEIPFCTKTQTIKIVGSVHGLLCVTDGTSFEQCRDLYLWNPCLRQHRTLASSCYKNLLSDWMHSFPVVGLGFHEPTNDYRIVRILYCTDNNYNLKKLTPYVEVYSLRRNAWKKLKNAVVPHQASQGSWAFVKGSVYWFESNRKGNKSELGWLLSFDFSTELFSELKCPGYLRDGFPKDALVTLMEFKGSASLCLSELSDGPSLKCCVWVMGDEGGTVSWSKQFKVVLKETVGWPMKFTNSGMLVMEYINPLIYPRVLEDKISLVSCNLNNLQIQDLGSKEPSIVDAAYMESLVLLEGGGNAQSRLTN